MLALVDIQLSLCFFPLPILHLHVFHLNSQQYLVRLSFPVLVLVFSLWPIANGVKSFWDREKRICCFTASLRRSEKPPLFLGSFT